MDLTLPLAVLGFGIIVAAGAWLGSGRFDIFCGLLGTTPAPPWPVGVQEADTPHFAVEHRAAAMGTAPLPERAGIDEEPAIEADVEVELVEVELVEVELVDAPRLSAPVAGSATGQVSLARVRSRHEAVRPRRPAVPRPGGGPPPDRPPGADRVATATASADGWTAGSPRRARPPR